LKLSYSKIENEAICVILIIHISQKFVYLKTFKCLFNILQSKVLFGDSVSSFMSTIVSTRGSLASGQVYLKCKL